MRGVTGELPAVADPVVLLRGARDPQGQRVREDGTGMVKTIDAVRAPRQRRLHGAIRQPVDAIEEPRIEMIPLKAARVARTAAHHVKHVAIFGRGACGIHGIGAGSGDLP